MNALAIQSKAGITSAFAGEEGLNEVRALTSCEVDEVAGGGPTLFAIGGILLTGLICMDYGQQISDVSVKLSNWIKGD